MRSTCWRRPPPRHRPAPAVQWLCEKRRTAAVAIGFQAVAENVDAIAFYECNWSESRRPQAEGEGDATCSDIVFTLATDALVAFRRCHAGYRWGMPCPRPRSIPEATPSRATSRLTRRWRRRCVSASPRLRSADPRRRAAGTDARQAAAATAGRAPARYRLLFLEIALAARELHDGEVLERADRGRRARAGSRDPDHRQRRHRQGRLPLPDHGEETPARPRDRAGEPAALRLSGRQRRCELAASGRSTLPDRDHFGLYSSTRRG